MIHFTKQHKQLKKSPVTGMRFDLQLARATLENNGSKRGAIQDSRMNQFLSVNPMFWKQSKAISERHVTAPARGMLQISYP